MRYQSATDVRQVEQRAIDLLDEGRRREKSGDLAGALSCYSESIAIYPIAAAYLQRARAYARQGRYDEAIEQCRHAISLEPTFGSAYNFLGECLIGESRLDEAMAALERAKALTVSDKPHAPWMNLGRIHALKGDVRRALREFEGALAVTPDEPQCAQAAKLLRALRN